MAAAAFIGAKDPLYETPIVDQPRRLYKGLETAHSAAQFAGEQTRDALIPPDVQKYAKEHDPATQAGLKRKPGGFLDAVKLGIPSAREDVPISTRR